VTVLISTDCKQARFRTEVTEEGTPRATEKNR
jgi:hypothetical protein